jgi:adenylosuccinate synthase
MAVDVILGLQWGDEGKGKIVDVLSPKYDIVARFQGGPNAGHTLEFGDTKFVLHQVPSGIFQPNTMNVIGNGVVLDPLVFKKEIVDLSSLGVEASNRIIISDKASLILPTHKLIDQAQEKKKGDNKIGSTLRGIGPAYQDKYGRNSIRAGNILEPDFRNKLNELVKLHLKIIESLDGDITVVPAMVEEFFEACEFLKKFRIQATEIYLNNALDEGKAVLAEGAQGSLLDVDFGSYPFVTSSNTLSSGACSGLGVSPRRISKIIGIFKAYCTRVGSGPFPSELFDDMGKELAEKGNEFGATTGRPRRVGWLDLQALKYSCMLNGVTDLFMMKADVLDGIENIEVLEKYPLAPGGSARKGEDGLGFEYVGFKGWPSTLNEDRENGISVELEGYKNYIEENLGIPIKLISYGPKREESLWMEGAVL